MMPPLIRQDWANHLIYGLLVFIICGPLAILVGQGAHRFVVGVACVAAVGLVKEGRDWLLRRKAVAAGVVPTTTPDPKDFAFTIAGGLLGLAAALIGAQQ